MLTHSSISRQIMSSVTFPFAARCTFCVKFIHLCTRSSYLLVFAPKHTHTCHTHPCSGKNSTKNPDRLKILLICVSRSFTVIERLKHVFNKKITISKPKGSLPLKPTSECISSELSSWQLLKKNGVAKLYIIKFNKLIMIFSDNSAV